MKLVINRRVSYRDNFIIQVATYSKGDLRILSSKKPLQSMDDFQIMGIMWVKVTVTDQKVDHHQRLCFGRGAMRRRIRFDKSL